MSINTFTVFNNNERILIIDPINGFGNRIRAIASAYIIAKESGRSFYINWKDESGPKNSWYVPAINSIFSISTNDVNVVERNMSLPYSS